MNVGKLIEQLQKLDPNTLVIEPLVKNKYLFQEVTDIEFGFYDSTDKEFCILKNPKKNVPKYFPNAVKAIIIGWY